MELTETFHLTYLKTETCEDNSQTSLKQTVTLN